MSSRPSALQYDVLVALASGTPLPKIELTRTITSMRQRGWIQVHRTGRPRLLPAGRHTYRLEWRRRAGEVQQIPSRIHESDLVQHTLSGGYDHLELPLDYDPRSSEG